MPSLSLKYRSAFPACDRGAYLNCAAVAPGSSLVRAAVNTWLDDHVANGNSASSQWWERVAEARARTAELIGAAPEEIAFVKSTSHGLSMVAGGLDWRSGDEVAVASAIEYPSNVFPWKHLADLGVRVREIEAVDGAVTPESVEAAIGPRTRLVAVSSVQFASGHRTDVDAIGRLCRDRDVLFVVDAIQQAGAFPMEVKASGIHAMAACSHKWMLGLLGIGFLYVDRDLLPNLRPTLVGWHSVEDPFAFDGTRFALRGDASRLEEAAPTFPMVYGFGAAVELPARGGRHQHRAPHHGAGRPCRGCPDGIGLRGVAGTGAPRRDPHDQAARRRGRARRGVRGEEHRGVGAPRPPAALAARVQQRGRHRRARRAAPQSVAQHVSRIEQRRAARLCATPAIQTSTTMPSKAHSSGTSSAWASISRLMWVRMIRFAPKSALWATTSG